MNIPSLAWIPLLPLLGAAFNLLIGRKLPRAVVHLVAVAVVLSSFAVAVNHVAGPLWELFKQYTGGALPADQLQIKQVAYSWIEVGNFKAELAFRLDTLSAVMILIVTGVGSLIHIY